MKRGVVLLCLFLLGCTTYSQPAEPTTVVSAVVYEIPYDPEVTLSIGGLRYPLHREGIPLILENVGKVSAVVEIRLTTSDIRDEYHVYCRKTDDSLATRPGQQIEHTFFLENCPFPRDSNINSAMKLVFEVVDASGEVLDRVERIMQDSIRNDRNFVY